MTRKTFIACCRLFAFILVLSVAFDTAAVDIDCPMSRPPGPNHNLPFDYTDPGVDLRLVEGPHFTLNVATLQSGNTSGGPEGDLSYTLTVIPNHHRALQSLMELALEKGSAKPKGMKLSAPCYFIRAANFAPADGMVDAIYAQYLARSKQKDMALTIAKRAMQKAPKNARVVYTVGLAYFYMDDYNTARDYAKMAKELGSTAVGLDNLLARKPAGTATPQK